MNASLTLVEVLAVVAPAFELTPFDVRGRAQSRSVSAGRTAFCAMAAEFTSRSDTEIARFLGRDFVTVVEARKRHARSLRILPDYKPRIWAIQQRLEDLRDARIPDDGGALKAARRCLGAGAILSRDEMQAVCSRLILVEQQFQELALIQSEFAHG
jgi:hypothetical protein